MLTVLKWFTNFNQEKRQEHPIISRTMCKVTLISSEYQGPRPRDGEWWWCQIVQETFGKGEKSRPDNLTGVFVVEPIRPVQRRILRLISGMYTSRVDEGVLIVRPLMNPELPWIMPKQSRDILRNKYKVLSVIVDLSPPNYGEVLQQVSDSHTAKDLPDHGEDDDYVTANSLED